MEINKEYQICEEKILLAYESAKKNIAPETIICNHIGTFSQNLLISLVSLIERSLTQNGESEKIKKRLIYLVIEGVQNIMFHANQLPEKHHLAFLIIVKSESGYFINSSNSLEIKKVPKFTAMLDELLNVKVSVLTKLLKNKIKSQTINSDGHAGIGVMTMVEKSDKNVRYQVVKISPNFALFSIKLNLLHSNFN